MRAFLQITLCCLLAGNAMAQRGGMGGGGARGGFGGGHGGFSGGFGGGFHGGGFGGFNGGFNRGGFAPFGGAFMGSFRGFRSGFSGGFASPFFNPYWGGFGFGLGLGYPGYAYPYDYGYSYPASYAAPAYNPSPNVTVVYPSQAQSAPVYTERATPVTREYDQYGQEIRRSGGGDASPIYLVAFKDHVIRAAAAYWVDGKTLHYVTLQHEEKQVALDTVDRELSLQLNRERGLTLNLPQ
ncbi:MAG: hypothetical protein LAQ69_06805 [Acidobacteriia bacterium]|nr:hypothetical protein [Terriglobia bacterium]